MMQEGESKSRLVKALYDFKGANNDELCFRKDDIITITQRPDGGWWEGTLDALTGWFPSNYVEPYVLSLDDNESNEKLAKLLSPGLNDMQQYRNMVFKDIMDTEATYIKEMQETLNKYLLPLLQTQIFPDTEISAVIRIIQEICNVHNKFLSSLESLNALPYTDLRIGGVFLDFAADIKAAHFEYCAIHAKFVDLIEKYKKEVCSFFASLNSPESSNVHLAANLSISFRRLDKYPALLQELQRYTDESHSDRGDTQRAGFVYRDISMSSLELRRQKEMELEVMLGNIKNWEGPNIQSFGEIIRMGMVSIQIIPDYNEMKKDRYLVLFPQILLVLSVSTEMNSFLYEALIKLEEVSIKTFEEPSDKLNIIEVRHTDEGTAKFLIQCASHEEAKEWANILQKYISENQCLQKQSNVLTHTPLNNSFIEHQRSAVPSSISDSSSGSNYILCTPQRAGSARRRFWNTRSLTPHPPTKLSNNSLTGNNQNAQTGINIGNENKQYNDDMMILQVIEAYCLGHARMQKPSGSNSEKPQIVLIDEEKVNQEQNGNFNNSSKERDIIFALQDDIKQIKQELRLLTVALIAEKKARKKLKNYVMEGRDKK